ncbi:hypothetical protein [Gottfriedia acidiceleris]|uniref:LAGLIDADG homing endonuclease n=1 Tax=Gottfriedia acidiceleris TaxID=371036 RepID=A0ABY4JS12_9BACI|nr:hypothetical protein [Gottfriedia acidiceleris]UPM55457.1 hypothetical protein MY490_06340 [Gottfriedia acidiceleris]
MSELIKEKIDKLYELINKEGGIIDFPWCTSLYYHYFLHFNDGNEYYRAGSLIAFWGLLCEWEDGSGFPFNSGKVDYQSHLFDQYIDKFIIYSTNIQKKYPNLYFVIIESLKTLDKEKDFVRVFPNIEVKVFNNLRGFLELYNTQSPKNVYKRAFRDVGIKL